jgi:hypothetical protein
MTKFGEQLIEGLADALALRATQALGEEAVNLPFAKHRVNRSA